MSGSGFFDLTLDRFNKPGTKQKFRIKPMTTLKRHRQVSIGLFIVIVRRIQANTFSRHGPFRPAAEVSNLMPSRTRTLTLRRNSLLMTALWQWLLARGAIGHSRGEARSRYAGF
jgi:hypothetical protein